MNVLHTLKDIYVRDRRAAMQLTHLTLRGWFLRLFSVEKYWDELTARDAQLLNVGATTLAGILTRESRSVAELKTYQLVLKNTNAKLTERGNFLLALVTLITALGLTKLTGANEWAQFNLSGTGLLLIFGTAIFFAVYDCLRVRNRAAIHEELINIIEKHLQSTSDTTLPAPATGPQEAPTQVQFFPSMPVSTGALRRLIKAAFNSRAYSAMFKAGIVSYGIALVGISQTGLTLYDKELDAYSSKFKVEAAVGRTLERIDCQFLTVLQADCNLAKHKLKTSATTLDLLDTVVHAAFWVGTTLLIFSVLVFIGTPIVRAFLGKNST